MWVFWQWISSRLSPFLPSKQHANKQCSSTFTWAGWPRLGTNWSSQLCLDTTTLICRIAPKVVQWPPFPFLPSFSFVSFLREKEKEDREEKREMIWCLPTVLKLLFPRLQLSLPTAFILRSWNLLTLATWQPKPGCGKSQSLCTSRFILVTKGFHVRPLVGSVISMDFPPSLKREGQSCASSSFYLK